MVGTISSNQSQILDRRIEAIDKLWSSVIGLRIEFSSVIMFFNVAYPEEYMTKTTKSLPLLKDINQSSVLNSSVKYSEFDNYRPYFGETLWQVIYIYRGFLTRLGILVTRIKDNEEVKNWKEDELISKQLKALLSEDEYNEIQKTQLGAITITLAFLENKLVSEINNILSGRQSSLEGILNSIEMQKIIAKSSQTY